MNKDAMVYEIIKGQTILTGLKIPGQHYFFWHVWSPWWCDGWNGKGYDLVFS